MKRQIMPVLVVVAAAFAVGRSGVTSAEEDSAGGALAAAGRFADYRIVSAPTQPELEVLVRRLVRAGWEPVGGVTVIDQYIQAVALPAGLADAGVGDEPAPAPAPPDQPSPSPARDPADDDDEEEDFVPKTGEPAKKRTGGASRVDESEKELKNAEK